MSLGTNFESLANELLLDIFEYIPSILLCQTFYNLNQRFNQLILIHFREYALDFRSISQVNFHRIAQHYLPQLINSITSLCLSNNDDTPTQIELFCEYFTLNQFHSLTSLFIYDFCSNKIQLVNFQSLQNLTHLTLAGCYFQSNEYDHQVFIDQIWSLPKLKSCYLNIHFDTTNRFQPQMKSFSLKSLCLWGIEYSVDEMNEIVIQTPCLEQLSILLKDENQLSLRTNVSSIRKLQLSFSQIDENHFRLVFQTMSNLSILIIDLDEIFNGYQWETLIEDYLLNLKTFRLRMKGQYSDIDHLFQSFKTEFWLNKHQWFIRCHWHSNDIYLYTLPYYFKDLHIDFSMNSKSTKSNENFDRNYNSVTDLSCEKLNLSPFRFLNIHHVSLKTSFNDNFWQILPNIEQITSLDMMLNDEFQLKDLIQRLIRLESLSLNSSKKFMFKFQYENQMRIHRLDLRGINNYLTNDECQQLSQSSLILECEILFIKIENRMAILDLIKNRKYLRTLNLQCKDDQYDDEILRWLKDHLPLTCRIQRDFLFPTDIRIWIC